MDNLNELQQLWKTGKTNVPDSAEMLRTVRKYRRWQIVKSLGSILLVLLLAAAMISVVIVYDSQLWTTTVGEACFFGAMGVLLWFFAGSAKDLSTNSSNTQFLDFLKREQQRLVFFYEKIQWIGFLLACAGMIFYVYEGISGKPYFYLVYSLIAVYIFAGWFIVRPRVMKRKIRKLNDKIVRLEMLSGQLKNDNF
jgi:hypothetical protein